MTGTRPYREAMSVDEAVAELEANSGSQFDTRCVQALVDVVREAVAEQLPSELPAELVPYRAVTAVRAA